MKHVHHKEIKAWADGAIIQFFGECSQNWIVCSNPHWDVNVQHRIKPAEPHQELKNKFAKGSVQIEVYNEHSKSWVYITNPKWKPEAMYRIRKYEIDCFYHAEYEGFRGIALCFPKGWKFMATGYWGATYCMGKPIIHAKVVGQ